MQGSLFSAAASASAFTRPNCGGQRRMPWCCSILAHVLAAILALAVSGASPWLQDLSHYTFSFWPIWLGSSISWPQMRFLEGRREGRPGTREATFLCSATAAAALYCQACSVHVAMRLQCCDRFFYTCTLQVSCCFLPALLWVKESLQVWKSWENGCAFIVDWVTAGQLLLPFGVLLEGSLSEEILFCCLCGHEMWTSLPLWFSWWTVTS